jgi:hypothetical protein
MSTPDQLGKLRAYGFELERWTHVGYERGWRFSVGSAEDRLVASLRAAWRGKPST